MAIDRGRFWLAVSSFVISLPVFLLAVAVHAAMQTVSPPKIDWTNAMPLTVVTVEYRFEPSHLVFRRGVAYRLQIVNRGAELHELTAPGFFNAIAVRDPGTLTRERNEIVVQPGEQKVLYFVSLRPGHFPLWCADHDWAGMTGDIVVK